MCNKSESQKAWYHKHVALGLCTKCSRPAVGGRRCVVHAYSNHLQNLKYYREHGKEIRARMQETREQYKLSGRCIHCSAPLTEDDIGGGIVSCMNCSERLLWHHDRNPYWRTDGATPTKSPTS